jgi:pyridoxamine 5'-phosphate oxidase
MPNPLTRLSDAYQQAIASRADWPEACCLATADASGMPAARMVLFRAVHPEGEDAGVTFFTNYHSAKSAELAANPRAAICIYWHPIQTQVRISGPVVKASREESDAYFAARPKGSQVGAWASEQSTPLARFEDLVERVKAFEKKFEGQEVPRPEHWGGWRLIAQKVEFWTEGEYRLHKRELYAKQGDGSWAVSLLNP